jgi:hypothetical protein
MLENIYIQTSLRKYLIIELVSLSSFKHLNIQYCQLILLRMINSC